MVALRGLRGNYILDKQLEKEYERCDKTALKHFTKIYKKAV